MDNKEAAIRARNLITERSEGSVDLSIPNIIAAIPTALEAWTRECFKSREKRELFKRSFEIEVEDGVLDLTPYTDGTEGRINLQELRQNTIYAGGLPVTWLASLRQLSTTRPLGGDHPAVFLEGRTLRTRTGNGDLDGDFTISFTVTSFPAAVTEISKTLEHDFILALADVVTAKK